jgi:hypothetical protein
MAATRRDPVSEQFDGAAARLLRRAYEVPRGNWTGTYVRNPSAEWMLWGARNSISLLGPDNAPGGQARTRWCRAFIRSAFYLHRWYYYPTGEKPEPGRPAGVLALANRRNSPWGRPLQYEVGTVRTLPGGIVVGRAVKLRTQQGGQAAQAAARRLPDSQRIYLQDGSPGGRFSSIAGRDW